MKDRTSNILRQVLRWGFVCAVFYFLIRVLVQNISKLETLRFSLNTGYFGLATLVVITAFFLWFFLWHLLTIRLGVALPVGRAMAAFFYSQMGKYLPGKVWMLAVRFYMYQKEGKSKTVLGVAVVLESFYHLAGHAAIFLVASVFTSLEVPGALRITALVLLIAGLLCMHPRILEKILNIGLRLVHRDPVEIHLSFLDLAGLLLLYMIDYMMMYLALFFLARAMYPLDWSRIADLFLACSTTGLVSAVALFAPAGLGVREGMFFATLRLIIPEPVTVVLVLVNRVWATAIEWCFIGGVYIVSRLYGMRGMLPGKDEIK